MALEQKLNLRLSQRLVMNFYTAKRLLAHLHYAVHKHEGYFGALEMDILRRARRDTPPSP